jgi:FkbM family methyltransferase
MKKILQFLVSSFGYKIIKSANFYKINRTLDHAIKSIIIKKNPVIFDIGAHEGESIERFKKLFKNPIIHSFEPQLQSFKILRSKKENEKIFLNNFGLGSKKEKKELFINSNTASSSYLNIDNKDKFFKSVKTTKKELTKIDTFDNYFNNSKIDFVDFVKIDVQGFEEDVLRGAIKSLDKVKLIEVEIVFVNLYEKKSSFFKIESILNEYNFELFSLSSISLSRNDDRIKNVDALYYNPSIKI